MRHKKSPLHGESAVVASLSSHATNAGADPRSGPLETSRVCDSECGFVDMNRAFDLNNVQDPRKHCSVVHLVELPNTQLNVRTG